MARISSTAWGRARGVDEFLHAFLEHVPENGLVIPVPGEPLCTPDPDGACALVWEQFDVPDELGHREEHGAPGFGRIAAADEGGVTRAGDGYC